MKLPPRVPRWVRLLPALVVPWIGTAVAQPFTPASPPVLTLRPAVVVSMATAVGRVYQMQASADLQDWTDVGEPVFGTGADLEQPATSEGQQFFRLKVLQEPAMGPAPWALENQSFQFNEGIRVVKLGFSDGTTGSWQSGAVTKTFTWTWKRTGPAAGVAELVFGDGSREALNLDFTAASAGRFSRWTYAGGRLQDTDAGSFGPIPQSSTSQLVPASIVGRAIALCDLSSGGSLALVNHSTGTRLLEGQAATFNGNWLVTGTGTARLTANFSPTHGEDYQFTFTGPQTGRFIRQTFTEGIFRDEDEGTFCLCNP